MEWPHKLRLSSLQSFTMSVYPCMRPCRITYGVFSGDEECQAKPWKRIIASMVAVPLPLWIQQALCSMPIGKRRWSINLLNHRVDRWNFLMFTISHPHLLFYVVCMPVMHVNILKRICETTVVELSYETPQGWCPSSHIFSFSVWQASVSVHCTTYVDKTASGWFSI